MWLRLLMVSKDMISPSCMEDAVWKSMHCLRIKVPAEKRLVNLDRDDLVLELGDD